MSLTEQDYKTIAIENGNTAHLLAERLRDAERRIANADTIIKNQEREISSLRSDLGLAVHINRDLSIQTDSERFPFIDKLLRLVRNGDIDLTVTLAKHEGRGVNGNTEQDRDNPED